MVLRIPSLLALRTAKRTVSYSTIPAINATENFSESFRTSEADPRNHTLDHEGKFYSIDEETYKNVFSLGGFSTHFRDQLQILGETSLMVRRPALEVMHHLKTANYSLPPNRYILYSQHVGAGMTLSLAHIIHYAWLMKWLIVHCYIPFSWVRTSWNKNMTLSSYNPLRLDQNREASIWLAHFKQQNAHLIDEIKLSKSYTWSKREISEEGQPLSAVIEHGLSRLPHATDCVSVILKEIKLQSGPNSFRTFVAIDGVNVLYGPVKYKRPDGSTITINDLSLLRGFKELLTNDWSNGAVVVSTDMFAKSLLPVAPPRQKKVLWPDKNPYVHNMVDPTTPIVKKQEYFPKALLGPEGYKVFDPFVPVEVVKYSLKEFNSCFDYYIHRNFITSEEGRSLEGRQELQFLSGLIPMELMKYCATL